MHPGAMAIPAPGVIAASSSGGNGWLYDVLTKSGLAPSTARDVNELVIRPLEILIVVLLAVLAAHFGAKALRRMLRRVGHPAADRMHSERASGRVETVAALAANVWRFVVVVVAILVVLSMFGIDLTPLLASATVVGATIGFGAQALVRDYLSGALLTMEDQFGIGDAVHVTNPSGLDTLGVVEDLSLRVTRVRANDGIVWFIPNGDVRRLGNVSRGRVQVTVDLPVVAGRAEDLDRARSVLLAAAARVGRSEGAYGGVPGVLGITEAKGGLCTVRVALTTGALERDEVEYALREACVRALMDAGLWASESG